MTRKRLVRSLALLAASVVAAVATAVAADPSAVLVLVPGASIQIDGQPSAETRLFTNQEKTVLLACPPGTLVYRIYRKQKNVVALRRPTIMVTGEKCRPMEGAAEQPVGGAAYEESPDKLSFTDKDGRRISVSVPAGTLR